MYRPYIKTKEVGHHTKLHLAIHTPFLSPSQIQKVLRMALFMFLDLKRLSQDDVQVKMQILILQKNMPLAWIIANTTLDMVKTGRHNYVSVERRAEIWRAESVEGRLNLAKFVYSKKYT